MTKRLFYPMFRAAYLEAFTQKNIESAFEKTGIWPLDPKRVLSKLRKPELTPASSLAINEPDQLKTLITCRSIRRIHKAFKASRWESILELILHANERLAAQVEITNHIVCGLHKAINIERKRRKKGKRLNLLGEDDVGP